MGTEAAFRLERLAPGVHVARALEGGDALCNAGIIDLGDATVVFDSMLTPRAGEELRRAAESLTGRPTAWVVNSHYHGDHVRGNASFRLATVVSTERTRELLEERAAEQLAADRGQAPLDLVELAEGRYPCPPTDVPLLTGWFRGIVDSPEPFPWLFPSVTFQRRLTLRGSSRSVDLLSFGGGHSPSDVLLCLRDEQIVFLGDLLAVGFHPWLTDGDPFEFARILGEVEALRPARAVPGHGDVGGPEAVPRIRDYIQEMISAAEEALARGEEPSSFARRAMPPDAEEWRFRSAYRDNLTFVLEKVRTARAH